MTDHKIYIVYGNNDRISWPICWCTSQEEAESKVKILDEQYEAFKKLNPSNWGISDAGRRMSKTMLDRSGAVRARYYIHIVSDDPYQTEYLDLPYNLQMSLANAERIINE